MRSSDDGREGFGESVDETIDEGTRKEKFSEVVRKLESIVIDNDLVELSE